MPATSQRKNSPTPADEWNSRTRHARPASSVMRRTTMQPSASSRTRRLWWIREGGRTRYLGGRAGSMISPDLNGWRIGCVSQAGATGLYQRSNNRRRGTGDGTTAETLGKLISLGVPSVVSLFHRRPSPVPRRRSPVLLRETCGRTARVLQNGGETCNRFTTGSAGCAPTSARRIPRPTRSP
jgi:hypothetical protein